MMSLVFFWLRVGDQNFATESLHVLQTGAWSLKNMSINQAQAELMQMVAF